MVSPDGSGGNARAVLNNGPALEGGEPAFLEELPHIGAKTAERIVTELRGKMTKFALAHSNQPLSIEKESAAELKEEALAVLLQLEYSRAEAHRMVEDIFSKHKNLKSTEDFLRKVFEQGQQKSTSGM